MNLEIIDEGVVWKNPYPAIRSLYAFHGHTENLGNGELVHAMRLGQARSSRDCRCAMLRSTDHGKTWKETTPLIPEQDPAYSYFTGMVKRASGGTLWTSSMRFHQA